MPNQEGLQNNYLGPNALVDNSILYQKSAKTNNFLERLCFKTYFMNSHFTTFSINLGLLQLNRKRIPGVLHNFTFLKIPT